MASEGFVFCGAIIKLSINNKHHRRSRRLKGYDYSAPGGYFVTVCIRNRICLFGDVVNGRMFLNDAGIIAQMCLRQIPEHYPNVVVDTYVVMPNHIHAIIIMNNNVGANDYSPLQGIPHGTSKTIGAVIRGYKIGVTKWMRENTKIHDIWQRNYYEHVIRDERELQRLREYIVSNPMNWIKDQENPRLTSNIILRT